METMGKILLMTAILALMLPGCYIVRESAKPRDDYFQPVTILPQRNRQALSSIDVEQLKNQLESATAAAIGLRDSLASLQSYAGSLLSSTRDLVEKVSELEAKEFLTSKKQIEVDRNITELKSENKQLSEKLSDLETKFISAKYTPESISQPAERIYVSRGSEYEGGLLLFYQRQYGKSCKVFESLLEKGIENNLVDNCEYWMGECSYAQKKYSEAVIQFQRVLTITSSNKRKDAYFMLGKSYEKTGNLAKAKWAYEELNERYPGNDHSRVAKSRLDLLKRKSKPVNSGNTSKSVI
jgi:TolA-binding protein